MTALFVTIAQECLFHLRHCTFTPLPLGETQFEEIGTRIITPAKQTLLFLYSPSPLERLKVVLIVTPYQVPQWLNVEPDRASRTPAG